MRANYILSMWKVGYVTQSPAEVDSAAQPSSRRDAPWKGYTVLDRKGLRTERLSPTLHPPLRKTVVDTAARQTCKT